MNSLNLVEDIENTKNNDSNIYIENETNSSYIRYLELLDMYLSESCKPKFINKYNYYVDNEGRFVKEPINKSDVSDSMVIVKPKYIDITNRLDELDKTIQDMETTLRQYRTGLLNNDLSIKYAFDKLYKIYISLLNERNSIKEYNNKVNNLDTNKELKLKLKLDNIKLNLTQYSLFNSIKLFNEDEDIEKYLLNNDVINSNITKSNSLKNKQLNTFLVSEVFDNNLPTKKKIKLKKLKKKKKPEPVEEPVEEPIEEPIEELVKELEPVEEEPEPVEEEPVAVEEPDLDLGLEEIDLSKDALDRPELKVDLKSTFKSIFGNDSDSDEEYVFNKEKQPPTDDTEELDLNLQELSISKDKGKGKSKPKPKPEDVDSSEDIDLDLDLEQLSKQLNKKAKGNIKLIKVDKNLKFSDVKCDDTKTKRSDVKTTNMVNGKKTRKKDPFDQDLKNCMFPFKEIKGRGKKKTETVYNECTDKGGKAEWCATERKDDCTMKKWAYCEK